MPRGWVGKGKRQSFIRCQAYYEFKDVPVKMRVYRYWYFRYFDGGRLRSIYCGKQRPELSPLQAVAALLAGKAPFREARPQQSPRFREQRSPLPKPKRGGT